MRKHVTELEAEVEELRLAKLQERLQKYRQAAEWEWAGEQLGVARGLASNTHAVVQVGSGGATDIAHAFLLKDILQEEARRAVTIEQIQRAVAEHYDVRLADMTSKRRPANIAFPRQVAMYLARELTKSSLNEIGDAFGGRDHGTVLHAHRLVKKRIGEEEKLRQVVSLLDSQLQR